MLIGIEIPAGWMEGEGEIQAGEGLLFAGGHAIKEPADLLRCGFNLFATLFGSSIIRFGCEYGRPSDHDG